MISLADYHMISCLCVCFSFSFLQDRLRHTDSMLEGTQKDLEEAENNRRNLEVGGVSHRGLVVWSFEQGIEERVRVFLPGCTGLPASPTRQLEAVCFGVSTGLFQLF